MKNTQHLQHVNLREAQTIFFQHVEHVIFEDHEIRALQGLLVDYNRIVTNHGHSSLVKSNLSEEPNPIIFKGFGSCEQFHNVNVYYKIHPLPPCQANINFNCTEIRNKHF